MATIKKIEAYEILNSLGNPTIETTVILSDGTTSSSSFPSGTSLGSYEALELKDLDPKRYAGRGVQKAISNIKTIIAPRLIGIEASKQQEIDKIMIELDGTFSKSRLGANAVLSVSQAAAKAEAKSEKKPLFSYLGELIKKKDFPSRIPAPAFNLISGGKRGGRRLDFQEFLVIPASSKSYTEALEIGVGIFYSLRRILEFNGLITLVGDEGEFGPDVPSNLDAFSLLKKAIGDSFLRFGFDIFLGLDSAASTFYIDGKYHLKSKALPLSPNDLVSYYEELNKSSRLLYLEDPFAEDDWNGWENMSHKFSIDTIIAGDTLTATNPYRLQMAIDKKVISGVVIKPNQIGTVMETLAVVEIAKQAGLKIIVSHRSGETNDDFIADFAVAVSADYVKLGAPVRGERVAKYNRLLQIEKELKEVQTT